MKTTQIYRVLSENATLLVAYINKARALYELSVNPLATTVVKGPMTVAEKPRKYVVQMPVAVYGNLHGHELRMAVHEGCTWAEALALAPRNYMLIELVGE